MGQTLPQKPASSGTGSACTLCGLPAREGQGGFCCPGCRHVFEILQEMLGDLDPETMRDHDFFRRMLANGVVPGREADIDTTASRADRAVPPGTEVEERIFKVEGMRCPSCSWLIERVLGETEGVISTTASFSFDRVKVTYLPGSISPDRILGVIEGIGYHVKDGEEVDAADLDLRRDLIRLGISVFLTANVMMLSFGIYQGFFVAVSQASAKMIGLPAFLMSTLVVFYCGFPILDRAVRAAAARAVVMETLIASGAIASYGLSLYGLLRGSLHLYFDTASMLVTLVLIGKFLEGRIRIQATRGIEEIYDLMPGKARLLGGDREQYVSIDNVEVGDQVRVVAEEMIPVDGVVLSGSGVVEESKLTGEAGRRRKGPGDPVLGASDLLSGELVLRASGVGRSSAIGRMIVLMEEAVLARNPAERMADRIMTVFTPAVITLAVMTAIVLAVSGHPFDEALVRAITVLVIACPCALGIAIPLARIAVIGRARRTGILVVNAEALEKACRLTAMIFDKTGTATQGKYEVLGLETSGSVDDEVLQRATAVEAGVDHPVAMAIRVHAARSDGTVRSAMGIESIPGLGVRGEVEGSSVAVGSRNFLQGCGIEIDPGWIEMEARLTSRGETVVYVAWDGTAQGMVRLGDGLREDMAQTVETLQRRGIEVHLLSGDARGTTAFVARALGVDHVEGEMMPADKVARVRTLQRDGHCVGMAGDGANDAAALAAADVGFATGDALTVTKHASDITLLSFSGGRLLEAIDLSGVMLHTIGTNLVLALLYNLITLPLAVAGVVNPIVAVSLMLASSLTVIINSARIARTGDKEGGTDLD